MLTVLLQSCWDNNPVIAYDIFTRVGGLQSISWESDSKGLGGDVGGKQNDKQNNIS